MLVEACEPRPLLGGLNAVTLLGMDEDAARDRLLAALGGSPGDDDDGGGRVPFPGRRKPAADPPATAMPFPPGTDTAPTGLAVRVGPGTARSDGTAPGTPDGSASGAPADVGDGPTTPAPDVGGMVGGSLGLPLGGVASGVADTPVEGAAGKTLDCSVCGVVGATVGGGPIGRSGALWGASGLSTTSGFGDADGAVKLHRSSFGRANGGNCVEGSRLYSSAVGMGTPAVSVRYLTIALMESP